MQSLFIESLFPPKKYISKNARLIVTGVEDYEYENSGIKAKIKKILRKKTSMGCEI